MNFTNNVNEVVVFKYLGNFSWILNNFTIIDYLRILPLMLMIDLIPDHNIYMFDWCSVK